jgi:hypothetical protein
MRDNLLEFLFGASAVRESQTLGDDVVRLFEEAADEETEAMVADKKPLASALKDLGIDHTVIEAPQGAELHCDDEQEYRDYTSKLRTPDAIHALAQKGWVMATSGDQAMGNEPPDFKLNFIEIATAETDDKGPVHTEDSTSPDLEKVEKDSAKCDITEPPHDDDMNPVEYDEKGSKDGQKGVGKATDGKAPEGKPKGSTKQTESRRGKSAKEMAEHLLEMTSASAIPAVEAPMAVPDRKIDWKKRNQSMRKRRGEDEQGRPNR